MNIQLLLRTAQRGVVLLFPKTTIFEKIQNVDRGFYSMCRSVGVREPVVKNPEGYFLTGLLQPTEPLITLTCGLKYKVHLKRRCKDCYFIWIKGKLHVMCKTHPRHKQAQITAPERKTWILTSVSQKPKRPWW